MGDRLAHSKHHLMRIESAREQGPKHLRCALRHLAFFFQRMQPLLMVRLQIRHPGLHSHERQAMGRQYQGLAGDIRSHFCQRIKIPAQGIGIRRRCKDADIGGNRR